MINRSRWLAGISIACALIVAPAAALAYPDRPIRFIFPYGPGGAADLAVRTISERLAVALGQPVIVDYKVGANGIIGTELAAKAKPDGHTILFGTVGTLVVSPFLYKTLPYNPEKDFEPVTLVADAVGALMVHASFPATNVKEYVALAKAQPGKLSYGSSGNGNAGHLAGELFNAMAGINVVHVPFKGGGPLVTNLVGGHIQVVFGTLGPALPHIKSGRIRALAVSSATRVPMAPELPTTAEAGLASYEAGNWYGIFVPAQTPKPIIDRLNQEIGKILQAQEVKDAFTAQGLLPLKSTPEEFRTYVRSESEKWGKLIKDVGIKAD